VTLTDFDPDGEDDGRRRGALLRIGASRRPAGSPSRGRCRPDPAPSSCAPTSARAPTGAISRAAAFERTSYRFDVLADYGAFRDLQRHRLLTLRMAAAQCPPRLRRAGRDRRGWRARRLAHRDVLWVNGPVGPIRWQ
jgi:hypothetical protein